MASASSNHAQTISPAELREKQQDGETLRLLDVRTPIEYSELHAENAELVPLNQLDPGRFAEQAQDGPLYVLCRSGQRATKAAEKLTAAGVNAVVVEGGTLAWDAAGLPVVRGKKVMSLERQVRIAAGSLVLLGAILAAAVHIGFIALSGFVGAGLIFAGVTDTCGMGMLLAKMPWNRRGCDPSICPVEQKQAEQQDHAG
ncbi:MAG: rhodanese-like domain-containing protein [Phycisphaeraceae bacterium]